MVDSLKKVSIGSLLAAALLAGCTSGNSAIEPPTTSIVNPLSGTLEFAVGNATYDLTGAGGTVVNGLNVVTSYRSSTGLSMVLASTPAIVGPTGFALPATAPAVDVAAESITGTTQLAPAGSTAAGADTTFTQAGGVFSYGILPDNSTNQASNGSPTGGNYPEPFYVATQSKYLGYPPAYINVKDGTYPAGFTAFGLGFNSFAGTTDPVGTYTLNLGVPTGPTAIGTVKGTAVLASATPLATYPAPVFAGDGTGGGTVTLTIPAGVLETVLEVSDNDKGGGKTAKYTVVDHTAGPGTAAIVLPDTFGAATGDTISVTAIGADYRLYEASVGQSTTYASYDATGASAAPSLFFTAGPKQADITVSAPGKTTL